MTGCEFCHSSRAIARCAQCLCALYCNHACQRKHWKIHKQTCKSNANRKYVWTLHVNQTIDTTYWKIESTETRGDSVIVADADFSVYATGPRLPKPSLLGFLLTVAAQKEIPPNRQLWYHEIVFVFRREKAFLETMKNFEHLDCGDCTEDLRFALQQIWQTKF